MLTKAQIIAFSREMVRRVLTNETGVAPAQENHAERLKQLKAEAEKARQEAERAPAPTV
jgi:methylphosphotriester-DNA--protein-cysteine methyltransferase